MEYPSPTTSRSTFAERLRTAGIEPTDDEQLQLNKSLLVFATGIVSVTSMVWLNIYWVLGPQLSSTYPFAFNLLLVGNLLMYIRSGNFEFFRVSQLGLLLFIPFAMQWSIGTFIDASGVILWGLLAPVGAILMLGPRGSLVWFLNWVFFTALSGLVDYYLIGFAKPTVPQRTSVVFFALNFIAVSSMIYMLLRHSILEQQKIRGKLQDAYKMLTMEQARSERLLLNILPGQIAERLKNSDQTIADGLADVTVMFADIVNFTHVAEGMAPSQVFSMLNRIFSAFDELAEQFGLEKIKTIGDAYMVAGGISAGIENYSAAIADMAVAMRDLLRNDFAVNSSHLEVRIGIGTGPVVAGVVGKKKFIYDLWGDTVNIASRLTSEGVPGMIQTDVMTYKRLSEEFEFHEPQVISLKGKGEMTVYRLIGRRQPV